MKFGGAPVGLASGAWGALRFHGEVFGIPLPVPLGVAVLWSLNLHGCVRISNRGCQLRVGAQVCPMASRGRDHTLFFLVGKSYRSWDQPGLPEACGMGSLQDRVKPPDAGSHLCSPQVFPSSGLPPGVVVGKVDLGGTMLWGIGTQGPV